MVFYIICDFIYCIYIVSEGGNIIIIMVENMFLFWGLGSIFCWKFMIVLEEKGFGGYKNKLIMFSNKEYKGEDVLKFNF